MVLAETISNYCKILRVKAICPYLINSGNEEISFDAYLPEFGSKSGILIFELRGPDFDVSARHIDAAAATGIALSFLNAQSICSQKEFVATLKDWGYFGNGANLSK